LVPASAFKKWNRLISKTFEDGGEVEIRSSIEDLGAQVRLVAKQIAIPGV